MGTFFDNENQIYGRKVLSTNRKITGNAEIDKDTIKLILKEVLPTHMQNAEEETRLFNIYLNSDNYWCKNKQQRNDINNKVTVPTAYAITRTINGYCFGEPIKYIARDLSEEENASEDNITKQKQVEILSSWLDYLHNHDATMNATLCSSVCGLGYKLVLPATNEETEEYGVPFIINENIIYPQLAGIVYSTQSIPKKVLGFLISDYFDVKTNKVIGSQYTVWTKHHQFVFVDDSSDETGYRLVTQNSNGNEVYAYEMKSKQIPLIEYERNAFRKGDWEIAVDLLKLKNLLMSNRQDDIQQVVDYILVLMNCKFETEQERKDAINNRIFELQTADPNNPPSIQILKNALEQNSIQVYADYIDLLIQECVGIPNRQERGGGGGDTGQAVKYRNGFRDLENNAGIIIPKADKAELQFLSACIRYANVSSIKKLNGLMPYEVRCKFMRTLNDDIVSSSQAFATYYKSGLSMVDSLILSKTGTDPSEIAQHAQDDYKNGLTYLQKEASTDKTENTTTTTEVVVDNNSNNA